MTIYFKLSKLHVSSMEVITLYKHGVVIYKGTIDNLINNRKDLLSLEIIGDIEYKTGEGYKANIKK